uniref:Myomegalin n=1 Tax=Phallusia mammillata TaxID=59560 RepID=A0A6F9DNM3_9ASCI|nr:myomegalin [Phallusia mammillata]
MDSIIGEDPTLPLNFDMSMNMSQYPNTSGFATPVKASREANVDTPNSDPGVIYPAVLKVVGERLSPVTNHNMKDYSTQISDLKKENFSLKLRIFYMEERMQEQFDGDHEQLLKTNIELKVECDSLKKDLQDKNGLLIKASNAVACMESAGPAEMQRARNEAEQEVIQLREMMNDKVQYAEKEFRAAKQDAEECLQQALEMKKQLEEIKEERQNLLDELEQEKNETQKLRDELADKARVGKSLNEDEKKIKEMSEQMQFLNDELTTKDSTIVQLKNSLSSKQTLIELMNEEKETIYNQEVVPLQKETENLRKALKETEEKLKQSQRHEDVTQTAYQDMLMLQDEYQEHITEQQQKLDEYELATRQITEELEKRETEVKDLKDALKDSDEANDQLKSELEQQLKNLEGVEGQMKKDMNKRDRAITGLTQMLKKKDEEIQRLIEELKTYELKEEEFLSNMEKLERQKPQSSSRDSLIAALRSQLQDSDGALQDALDGKLHSEDEHQKFKRETNIQVREKDRLIESLQQQLEEYNESLAHLDTQIKERDAAMESMKNDYKSLVRQLKAKEEEYLKTLNERDELQQLIDEEKRKFAELAQRTLRRRSSSEFGSLTSLCENDYESKIKTLEQQLQNANEEKDKALLDINELRDELERALQTGEKKAEISSQKLAHQDVRIHQVEELLKRKEQEMNNLETKLRLELDKLARINKDLQDKLRNQQTKRFFNNTQNEQPEKPILLSSCSVLTFCSSGEEEPNIAHENISDLQQQIHKLLKKIATKDKIIQDLRTKKRQHKYHTSFHEDIPSESSSSSNEFEDEYGFEYHSSYHYKPSKSRKRRSRSSPRKLNAVATDGARDTPRRQSQIVPENCSGNQTLSNTIGIPLDQTSYLGMPDGYRGNPEQDFDESLNSGENAVRELRDILQQTRNELSNAIKEASDLRKVCIEQDKKLEEFHNYLNQQIAEKTSLADELNATKKNMMEKEAEILGLLARIKDGQLKPKSKTSNDNVENGFSDDSVSVSSQMSRNLSGDESDGMSSLKRKELRDVIGNLRKKLDNAEKVNDLLKHHLQQQAAEAKQQAELSAANPKLVDELSAEVERLKAKLQENDRNQPIVAKHEPLLNKKALLLRSKLPVPKDKVGNGLLGNNSLQQELDRARMHNRKLNERLASTEQTVRQQAEKLNKCKIALKEAGIVSPPLSPIRAARSVPNLFQSGNMLTMSPELTPYDDIKANAAHDHSSSSSSDTSDVGTQTSTVDSGIQIVSPKVEQKYNSLIQAQAKELSDIRQQIQQARENTAALDSEMDVLNQYVESLLNGYDNPDPALANGVKNEIEHSKSLIRKLRSAFSNNTDDTSNSDSDRLYSSEQESVVKRHSAQVQRLTMQLHEKNIYINELQSQLEKLNDGIDDHRTESQALSGDTYTAERWLQVPNESITYSSHSSPSIIGAKQHHLRGEPGKSFLSSSHPSLHTAQEDELLVTQDESSRLPSALTDNDDRFVSLPSMFEKTPPRLSWPLTQNHSPNVDGKSPRRSMPMYQKTIAVTEYLPPNLKSRKDPKHSSSSMDERKTGSRRKHLQTNSEEAECTAAYAGAWIPVTPQKFETVTSPPKHRLSYSRACAPSSCDDEIGQDEHRMSRELDRLRRRLSDSKRINRTLKEELELATRSLQRAKDSIVPGYQRSPHRTTDMLAQHLSEIRGLRQRLEASIATNDNLRVKLEERLKQADTKNTDHVAANIYVSSENGNSPRNQADLRQRLHDLEDENVNLSDRLVVAEKGRKAYEDALNQMNKLEQRLFEKSSQTDVLAQHIDQLQNELQQQNQFSERLTNELASRDQQLRQLKAKVEENENEKQSAVNQLRHEKNVANRLRNDLGALENQLEESRNLIDTLKSEVALHEKLSRSNSRTGRGESDGELDLTELLQEIRSLRTQLERSIDANSALRKQLEEQLKGQKSEQDPVLTTINIHHMSPRKSSRQSSPRSGQNSARRKLRLDVEGGSALMTPPASASSGAEDLHNQFFPNDESFAKSHSKNKPHFFKGGEYTMCKSEDFSHLQKNLLDSGILAHSMQENISGAFAKKTVDKRSGKELSRKVGALLHNLAQNDKLLEKNFWPVDLSSEKISPPQGRTTSFSSSGVATGGQCSCSGSDVVGPVNGQRSIDERTTSSEADGLRREVGKLRHRLSTQDRLLQSTVERLHTTNRLKEGIENAIVQQLSRTHTVLRKARGNLEANVQQSTRK